MTHSFVPVAEVPGGGGGGGGGTQVPNGYPLPNSHVERKRSTLKYRAFNSF